MTLTRPSIILGRCSHVVLRTESLSLNVAKRLNVFCVSASKLIADCSGYSAASTSARYLLTYLLAEYYFPSLCLSPRLSHSYPPSPGPLLPPSPLKLPLPVPMLATASPLPCVSYARAMISRINLARCEINRECLLCCVC